MTSLPITKHLEFDIQEKFKKWKNASEIYYSETDEESPLSDSEFDSLTRELIAVGDEVLTKLVTTKIQTTDGLVDVDEVKTLMISLFKIDWLKNKTTLTIQQICKFLGIKINDLGKALISLKFDGHAIKVIFKGGEVVSIITRGGVVYTDLLKNSKGIQVMINELKKANYSLENNIYHCELMLTKTVYESKYSHKYKNPRNAVSGVVKLEPNDLTIIPLTDGISPLIRMNNWLTVDDFIKRNMTSVGEYSYNILNDIYNRFKSDKFPLRVDGLVIGYQSKEQIIKDNYPMNLVSIKFDAVTAVTTVLDVEWTQKKTGKLTPIYILEPTLLDGTTVSRASGYNYASMLEMKIGKGSVVEIEKSNDIIPKVVRTITKSKDFILPKVAYKELGRELYSTDDSISNEQKFILGLRTLNIDGIGEVTANTVGKILKYDIIELFNKDNKFKILEAVGDGVVYQKLCSVYSIKTLSLDELILLLQFNGVGVKLSNKFGLLFTGTKTDMNGKNLLENVDRNVIDFMLKGEGKTTLSRAMERLKLMGIKIIKPIEINDTTITYELSGNPQNYATKDAFMSDFNKKFPNAIKTSLTKNTKLLIVDNVDSSTGKANKARKYNVKIITYNEAMTTFNPIFVEDNQ